MAEIKLIVSDIDGTLLTSSHEITAATQKMVQKLHEKEIEVALASARAPKAMGFLAQQLALPTPLVCFNGALIVQKDQGQFDTLYSLPLAQQDVCPLYQMIQANFPAISLNVYSNHHWLVEQADFWVQQEAEISQVPFEVVSLKEYLNIQRPVHKILCMGPPSEIDQLQQAIEEMDTSGIAVNKSKDTYLEIVHQQVSKLAALQFLAQKQGLALSNTLAIGDNYNDQPMIQSAGIGIAMGNAPQAVKQAADKIAPANDEDGFYYGINECLQVFFNN